MVIGLFSDSKLSTIRMTQTTTAGTTSNLACCTAWKKRYDSTRKVVITPFIPSAAPKIKVLVAAHSDSVLFKHYRFVLDPTHTTKVKACFSSRA